MSQLLMGFFKLHVRLDISKVIDGYFAMEIQLSFFYRISNDGGSDSSSNPASISFGPFIIGKTTKNDAPLLTFLLWFFGLFNKLTESFLFRLEKVNFLVH